MAYFQGQSVSFREVNPTVKGRYFVEKNDTAHQFCEDAPWEYVPEFYHIRHMFGKDTSPTDMRGIYMGVS